MDNQHRKISGYRELSAEEIALMNDIKAKGLELGELIEKVSIHIEAQFDKAVSLPAEESKQEIKRLTATCPLHWLDTARTSYQTATMFLVRAVAQPTDGM